MSLIADFALCSIAKLDELTEDIGLGEMDLIAAFDEIIHEDSKLQQCDCSGYVYEVLFAFLLEKEMDFTHSVYEELTEAWLEDGCAEQCFIISRVNRDKYLKKVCPENFSRDELVAYVKEFSGECSDRMGDFIENAVKVLYENMQRIDDDNALIYACY